MLSSKKMRMYIIRIAIVISVAVLLYKAFTVKPAAEKVLEDYRPDKLMIKFFDDGYENEGYVEVIDEIKEEYYQKKIIDSGKVGVAVYRVNKDGYKIVYREEKIKEDKKDYISEKANLDLILLKEPLKVNISWINPDDSTYRILSTNEKIKILGKMMNTIKLQYINNSIEYVIYFAKGYGIVRIESETGVTTLKKVGYDVEEYLSRVEKK